MIVTARAAPDRADLRADTGGVATGAPGGGHAQLPGLGDRMACDRMACGRLASQPRQVTEARGGERTSAAGMDQPPAADPHLCEPLAAVDEFTHRVEVAGMTGRLGDHVKHDRPEVREPPVGPDLDGPDGRRRIQRRGGDDGVGEFDLLPVGIEYGIGRNICSDLPGLRGGLVGARRRRAEAFLATRPRFSQACPAPQRRAQRPREDKRPSPWRGDGASITLKRADLSF